jgi:hypothetical protein
MKTFTFAAILLAAAALAACGGDDGAGDPAGAVSIEEAVDAGSDEPQLVSGNLLALGEEIRLCSALAESFPPQCGGASLVVEGLILADVDGVVTEGDVSWTDRPVELLGVVVDGTLTVSDNALS